MSKYVCNHCTKVSVIVKKKGADAFSIRCPFCDAAFWDLFSEKTMIANGKRIPEDLNHGDYWSDLRP